MKEKLERMLEIVEKGVKPCDVCNNPCWGRLSYYYPSEDGDEITWEEIDFCSDWEEKE